jgi:chromosome segregation ATPase
VKRHSRDTVLAAILRWNELFGEPPRAADLNPSAAKWSAQEWRIPRYRAGDPVTGEPWPSLNAVKKEFGGSLNAAIRAAGLEPAKPGPSRRKDVDVARAREQMHPDARVALDAAHAEVRDLRERLEVRERMLARERAREPRELTRTVVRVRTVKERVPDLRAVRAVERRLAAAEDDARRAREAASEARKDASRASQALARRERALVLLREEKADLRRELSRAERRLEDARAAVREVRVPVERVVERIIEVEAVPASTQEVRDAIARAEIAEARAERAQRALEELSIAATGRRDLTPEEIRELTAKGPAGPAVLADALRSLALARKSGTSTEVRKALRDLASAAVSWMDRT